MAQINLKSLQIQVQKEVKRAKNLKELDRIYRKYLGKKGLVSQVFDSLKNLSPQKRAKVGKEANKFKKNLEKKIKEKSSLFVQFREGTKEKGLVDITVPGRKPKIGNLHPLTLVKKKIEEIFQTMGFSVVEGPEIENEYYNFDALNIPADHPARDLWNTLWLKTQNSPKHPAPNLGAEATGQAKRKTKLLLRTHTSPVQVRYMEKNSPPLRIIVPGRVFRHEATDASHDIQFYQVEGLMIGKDITAGNFKAIIQELFSRFFGEPIKIRLRPSFFPFTEPSFEVDMNCLACGGKGCSTCSKTGWIEIMGAGMVHPNVIKSGGYNPKDWQGFAFGIGMDRLAMMKYKINDIRLFYSGDLRFLQQF